MSSPSCPLRSPVLRDVARWWVRARTQDRLPSRHGIDPAAIRLALPYVWLLEHLPEDGDFRYRLAGEHVNATFGFSLRGKRLGEAVEPHMLATVRARCEHALKTPGAVHVTGRVYMSAGRHREGERLILPLADDGVTPSHLLGVTDYGNGQIFNSQPPPEYMDETFLTLVDVVGWWDALNA